MQPKLITLLLAAQALDRKQVGNWGMMTKSLSEKPANRGRLLRLLFVENSLADADLSVLELIRAGFEFSADVVQTREEFTKRVHSKHYDIVSAE